MGSEFSVYLQLGLHHIADVRGYDHILFITALTAPYRPEDWKRLLWLVTAFTLGHSITLILATLDLIRLAPAVVEPAIAATIMATGVAGLVSVLREGRLEQAGWQAGRYGMAAGFGLIHGLGFSNFLRSLLGDGNLALPLLAFNLGLEVGQLLIVAVVLGLGFAAERLLGLSRRRWVGAVALAVILLGGSMLADRIG